MISDCWQGKLYCLAPDGAFSFFLSFSTTSSIYANYKVAPHTHTQLNTHTHSFAHYVKYQMVKKTFWSHRGELGWLPSHAFQKLLGLSATLAITLQLSHHYSLVHRIVSVLSILNHAGPKLISLSSLFSCLWGSWIFLWLVSSLSFLKWFMGFSAFSV